MRRLAMKRAAEVRHGNGRGVNFGRSLSMRSMVRQRGCAMRAMIWGAMLLAGPAVMGQNPSTSGAWAALPQAGVTGEAQNFFVQAKPLPMQFAQQEKLPEQVWMQGQFSAAKPGLPLTQNGAALAMNHFPMGVAPQASLAGPGAIPIPTLWPHAKVEAIPTRWAKVQAVPIGGADSAAQSPGRK
jgi:hypothetical protein